LDGAALTAIRTGAATGLATDYLARNDASTAAVFGAGVQGRTQLEAVHVVRPLSRVRVFDPNEQQAKFFADAVSQELGVEIEPASSAAKALRDADIVCAASTSRTPIFADEDIAPGTHVNAIGSYQPEVREIPAETVARAKVVVDHRESALEEAGDLIIAIEQGRFAAAAIHAELGQLASGEKPGRTSESEVTFFKSVGVAVQDVAAAARAAARAEEKDLGTLWLL
jgi:ornithine cyclodeaminase/alanine dehydrogenase-like protein (mu-crystallin family)